MKRRKMVSVTPAMGASTVAGRTSTGPIEKDAGTRAGTGSPPVSAESRGLSIQCFFMDLPSGKGACGASCRNRFGWSLTFVTAKFMQ